jgi:hypothetical protein
MDTHIFGLSAFNCPFYALHIYDHLESDLVKNDVNAKCLGWDRAPKACGTIQNHR